MAKLSRRQTQKRGYGYDRLTAETKQKLHYQGIGREDYVKGYNLKKLPPLTKARREGAVQRVGTGQERRGDMGIVQRWYRSRYAPPELKHQPGVNKAATTATLAQVSDWSRVTNLSMEPSTAEVWNAVVTYRGGRTEVIQIPSYVVEDIRAALDNSDIENDIGGSP